ARPSLEFYASAGQGFHSNDARGTTITVDPNGPSTPAQRVTPLARSNFAELGVRRVKGKLQSTLALYALKFNSELLFVGDAGTTEASRPSRRFGVEFTNYWTPRPNLIFDADFATARARFRDSAPEGKRIPGAIEGVASLGASYEPPQGFNGALRLRYFGPRPLIEDNSVRSSSSTLVNGRIGYKFKKGLRLSLEGFNLFNKAVSDIDYYYTSRLPGESADGVDDIHTHPAEKRSFRLALSRQF
ncbi:TonB-dependent receptor, partial [bacterium]